MMTSANLTKKSNFSENDDHQSGHFMMRHIKFAYVFTDHDISLFVINIPPGVSDLMLSYSSATVVHSYLHCWRTSLIRKLESNREETNIHKLNYPLCVRGALSIPCVVPSTIPWHVMGSILQMRLLDLWVHVLPTWIMYLKHQGL